MSKFLETLKLRLADAQVRHQEAVKRFQAAQADATAATQRFQAANAEFQALSQEMTGWAKAVEVEGKREAAEAQTVTGAVVPNSIPASVAALPLVEIGGENQQNVEQLNKTELVREVLRSHPNGLKPVEVWKLLQDRIPHRNYVYSVLGRLKDREVNVRRGKYFYRASIKAVEEEKPEQPTVQ